MDETAVAARDRARLRRVVDLARRGLRGRAGAVGRRSESGWVMSADGVIGAPGAGEE
ncbi:hypothetical protein [Saccharothrix syringae]|uniref:hypothetical protein n=1 Tax=Saccharothrix syringae TaxID=103733 RepID=UPI001292FD6A|nr:hypothetical protein [Saccharothrix syringae]